MKETINKHLLPLMGAIAGDIIGSPYELKGCRIKTTDFPLFSQDSTFTDDTILTLAVAQWVVKRNSDLISLFHTMGNKYINVGFGHAFKCWLRSDSPKPYNSWGNGSAMRVSSIGLACGTLQEVLDLAEQTASITHNHPEGIKGAQAVAASVYLAYWGFSKLNIKDYIEKTFEYNLNRTIEDIRETYSFDSSCQGSVPEAIISFLESTNFEDAIRLAVSLGGDADTQASIAGAIAGAFYKKMSQSIISEIVEKLPNELLDILYSFNDFIPPQKIMLAVTAKEDTILKCHIQYSFALAYTGVQDVFIPKATRLELSSVLISDENKYDGYATFHLINNRKTIFSILENEIQLKYPEYIKEDTCLVERILLYSKTSELEQFEISPLTMEDVLAQI